MRPAQPVVLASLLACAGSCLAQSCPSLQAAPFAASGGTTGAVAFLGDGIGFQTRLYAALTHDFDGPGPLPERLFISGSFLQAGGSVVNGIAAFDGQRWHPLGRGLNLVGRQASAGLHGGVDMVIRNNELYVAGVFTPPFDSLASNAANGVYHSLIAKWNGMSWEPVNSFAGNQFLSGGEVWDLEVFRNEVYVAFQSTFLFGSPGGGNLAGIAVIRPDRIEPIETPLNVVNTNVYGLTTYNNELLYGRETDIRAWNGSSVRILPNPRANASPTFFPSAGIEVPAGIVLAGNSSLVVPSFGIVGTALFNGSTYVPLSSIRAFVGAIPAARPVWRFTNSNGQIRAWALPNPQPAPSVFRLENNAWILDSFPVASVLDNYLLGDVTFQNNRYVYGNSVQAFFSTINSSVPFDPFDNFFRSSPTNTVIPLDGIYVTRNGRSSSFPQRPTTQLGSDIVFGGPFQFVGSGQTSDYVAKWNGSTWSRVASNQLTEPPQFFVRHDETLYTVAALSNLSRRLLRIENGAWITVPGTTNLLPAHMEVHNNELWAVSTSAVSGGSLLNRITPTGAVAAPTTGLPATLTSPRLLTTGPDLYLTTSTNLYRFTGTAWTNIPLTGGPTNVLNCIAIGGTLHAVSPSTTNTPVSVHRYDGTTWSLVSTAPTALNTTVAGVSEIDGVLYVVGSVGVNTLDLATGTWANTRWPGIITNSTAFQLGPFTAAQMGSNVNARVLKDATGRTLIFGPFESVGITRSVGIAVLRESQITVHWPPFARRGTPGSTISIAVGATGPQGHDGDLTYQWFRNDQPLTNTTTPSGTIITGATTKRLQLRSTSPADAGLFSVRITLPCGVTLITDPAPITIGNVCNDIDFNNNNISPENQDVIDFFNVLAGAECLVCDDIDFNNNSVFPEDQDVIDFFTVLAGGSCS